MASQPVDAVDVEEPPGDPRPLLFVSVLTAALTVIAVNWLGQSAGWLLIVLLTAACIFAGAAVSIRPMSPAVLGLAGLTALVSSFGFARLGWDSAVMVLRVLTVIGFVGAGVVVLPRGLRRAVASLVLLLHFGGILTAITSPPPGPWISNVMWTYMYRPYLQFMYLNNAYHFYSPEPGPAPVIWFCIEYERDPDGGVNFRWVKVPSFDHEGRARRPDGSRLWPQVEYTRRLSLAESANFPRPNALVNWQDLVNRRVRAGEALGIPLANEAPLQDQYRPVNDVSLRYVGSYVRHVSHEFPHPQKPSLRVTGVKVYRTIHRLMYPVHFLSNTRPDDPTLYFPYYLGEWDALGNPKPYVDPQEPLAPSTAADPFVFWLIPIQVDARTGRLRNYVLTHAHVPDDGALP